jgi:GNAT superfamily N-acetyltransferase
MELRDVSEKPEIIGQDSFDKRALERRLQGAEDVRPGTFRYSDAGLGGEVRTSVEREGSLYSIAKAEVFRPDGTGEVVGRARYSVAAGEATLYDDIHFTARNHGAESALLKEVGEQAKAQGADRLRVWVRDGDSAAERRWLSHGFQPTERDPGARGVHWERPL